MIFRVIKTRREIKVSRLIKIYKGALRLETSLGVNIFKYDKSWDKLSTEDRTTLEAELIIAEFPLGHCKRLTKGIILSNRNNNSDICNSYDNDDYTYDNKKRFEIHVCYESNPEILQTIDIPLEDLLYDVKDLTRNNYIIQRSLLELN